MGLTLSPRILPLMSVWFYWFFGTFYADAETTVADRSLKSGADMVLTARCHSPVSMPSNVYLAR